ncbi:MAG: chromosome segregation protein SMC [Candidatus Woesearchaeota archaeon]
MTRINKLVMHGFKSFAKRTEILFGPEFNCVLGPNGSGKSCAFSTEVLLNNGKMMQIGKMVEDALKSSKKHHKIDDGVFTMENPSNLKTWGLDPKTMKVVEKNISAFIKREGEPYLYEITTNAGKKVTTTGCHPVMVFKEGAVKSSLVKDLAAKDFIATPRQLDIPTINNRLDFEIKDTKGRKEIILPKKINKELARFFGYFVGDGTVNEYLLRFVNAEEPILKDFFNCSKRLFGIQPAVKEYRKNVKDIFLFSKTLSDFTHSIFNNDVKGSKKHIPNIILFSEKDILSEFLTALFDCDATVRKNSPTFEYTTKSEKLADQVQLALLRFGIVAKKNIKLKHATNTKNKTKRKYYYITIQGKTELNKLNSLVHMRSKIKRDRLKKLANNDVIANPNTDLIPKDVNQIIRTCKEILRIDYKPLRKRHPFFAAYMENRCCATREGINKTVSILNNKLKVFNSAVGNLKQDQKTLMSCMKKLNLSKVEAAKFIGVTRHTITDFWDKNIFQARPDNLKKLYLFVKKEIKERTNDAKRLIRVLERLSSSDIFWDQIVSIKKVKGEPYVYDLTIPDCHNFIGNGIFVHNSNILDALCFVLGKSSAKSMRVEKSANLIYNGGKTKKPSSSAEVSIYFDNSTQIFPTDAPEVKITRMVKKTGQGVYKINDEIRTRAQILELLSLAKIDPDGYNIILQGDIIKLIDMTPTERRQIIEEIAGISVYEDKKQKAVNEMERVDGRLKEAEIILTERDGYLKELKKERDQARKYKELDSRITINKATALHRQMQKKDAEKEELDERVDKHKQILDKYNKEADELRNTITTLKKQIEDINQEIERKGEKEQLELHREVEHLKINLATAKARMDACKDEIAKIKTRKDNLKETLNEVEDKIKTSQSDQKEIGNQIQQRNKEQNDINMRLDQFRKKNKLEDAEDIDKEIDVLDKGAEDLQKSASEIRQRQQDLLREKDKIEFQVQSIDEKMEKVLSIEKENKEQIQILKQKKTEFKKASMELSQLQSEESNMSAELGDSRRKLLEANEEVSKLSAKQAQIQDKLGANIAVKTILENKSKFKGVHGTVSELGEVNSKYALALEIAAGPKIKSIVVENDQVAAQCIEHLKKNRLGIATFLPLNKIRPKADNPGADKLLGQHGVHGKAINLITFDHKFSNVFKFVFESTLVVDNMDTAQKLGIGNAKMVTLDGDSAEISGAMTGGFRQRREGLGFSEKEVSDNIKHYEKIQSDMGSKISKLENSKKDAEEQIVRLRELKANLEGDIITMEKSLHLDSGDMDVNKKVKSELNAKMKKIDEEVDQVMKVVSEKNRELSSNKIKRQELKERISKLRSPILIAEMNAFEEKKREIRESLIKLHSEKGNLDIQLNTMLVPEKENISKIMKQHDKEVEAFQTEIKQLTENITIKERELKDKDKKGKEFYSQFKDLFNKRTKLSDDTSKKEAKTYSLNDDIRKTDHKINSINLELARINTEIDGMKKEMEQYEGVEIDHEKTDLTLAREINQFERIVADLGTVNLRALEIFDSAEKEYKDLLAKKSMLEKERDDVMMLMAEIEGKKKVLFVKTLEALQKEFQHIFSQLLTKGEASLVLENEENPFDGGMLINVRLTGEKFLDIRSLSGGEKTMTALAFLFAVQEYDPASFYVLDEVDAALDKKNSEKLSELIKSYCDKAQYIMISHNDGILVEADTLYGVSMNEHGVSDVVSLKI